MSIATIIEGHPAPLSVAPDNTIQNAAEIMSEHRIGFLLVLNEDGSLFGVISERDIVHDVAVGGGDYAKRPVSGIATTAVKTCLPTDDPHDIFERMTAGKFRHMPVAEAGAIIGVISMSDLLRHFEQESTPAARAKAFQAFFSGDAIPGG
ncbi:MAG: CBS domain-containing protein [Alphaproteobacteria bacterium]|jgi:CBS domain-containing protein|uniref:CBS domain-containing protein n=1 Tax=Pacificispira sp. TaxID=2888761 RepID=UPI001B13F9CE|nr:CBS domain-containing protein [Alphaproteobacteria bacterium]MBO6862971.1 CBS domain-containing protein [Alphaproteobacteria bacterium]MEC9267116.1 CBS domain-containing protein [Pseudomonadota bacterium]